MVDDGDQMADTRLQNSNLVTQSVTNGPDYLIVPGSPTATHADNWNVSNLPIGANDDFVMLAKLKVDGSGSAAGFIINDGDLFGFNGSTNSNGIFGGGAFSGVITSNFGAHSDNLFYFKVERKLGTIKCYINEQEVASFANYNVGVSTLTWRPWRAVLKIFEWTVSSPSLLESLLDQAGYVCLQTDLNTYSDSVQAAQNTGANLVSIRCSEQQAKVNLLPLVAYTWIGANDINSEGVWILADGHAMIYTNWKANEPKREDCVLVGSDGEWVDGGCHLTFGAVYESPDPISGLTCERYAGKCIFTCVYHHTKKKFC